jgi:hypothetical protein
MRQPTFVCCGSAIVNSNRDTQRVFELNCSLTTFQSRQRLSSLRVNSPKSQEKTAICLLTRFGRSSKENISSPNATLTQNSGVNTHPQKPRVFEVFLHASQDHQPQSPVPSQVAEGNLQEHAHILPADVCGSQGLFISEVRPIEVDLEVQPDSAGRSESA